MPPTIVHFSTDTLPRVVATAPGSPTLDLVLPFRVELGDTGVAVRSWALTVTVDGRPWTPRVRSRSLRAGLAADLRGRMDRTGAFSFTNLPFYAALDDAGIVAGRVVYIEGRLPQVPAGAAVAYTLTVTAARDDDPGVTVASPTYRTHVVDPRFTAGDVKRTIMPDPRQATDAYVVLHRRAAGLDQIRIDVLDLGYDGPPQRAALALDVDGTTVVDLAAIPREAAPGDVVDVPLVDLSVDSVTVAVARPDAAPPPRLTVRYRGHTDTVDLAVTDDRPGRARIMFVNFAIQGLNDLFTTPDDDYDPPRTYTQLTMRDETASYSSRPGKPENGEGDGYAFTIEAHRRFRVPQMWAMNGGLLGLLAHDRPDDLAAMAADVRAGWLVPVNTGYGAHRLPYYSKATNLDAMTFGSQALANILGHTRPVYYPDSRITVNKDDVTEALREAEIDFLVVDAGVHEDGTNESNILVDGMTPTAMGRTDGQGRFLDWRYLWHDRCSDTHVLFIDGGTKDKLLGSTPDEADRGTIALDLRRMFLDFAARPVVRADNLIVYSDDADKASGNGWFDGSTGNNQRYQAALSWVAAHPWVQAVTTDQLGPGDSVGDLNLQWASDPYIQNQWGLGGPRPLGLAFDTWYAAWAGTWAGWLGETLGAISGRAEKAIARRLDTGDHEKDEMVTLARLYFLMCLHESQWSKRPRIDPRNDPPQQDDPARQPEDFVVAESLQLRNAHVYLHASFWAEWAAATSDEERHRNDGPVVERVADFVKKGFEAEGTAPPWSRSGQEGLQWDHDPLPNVVLYNRHALVVVDRNGGRITHLFAMVGGRPVSVSGTHKAYQSLDLDWASDAGLECDGLVLQNTVCTPNHAYVACDVAASGTTVGESPAPGEVYGWAYPDNFNAYREDACDQDRGPAVAFTYGDTTPADAPVPVTIKDLQDALDADRKAKVLGQDGTVLHDVTAFGAFRKTIRLVGNRVEVSYRDTAPGHRVANEFCVDLLRSALHGQRQTHEIVDERTGRVTDDAGLIVRVELGDGCAFTEAPAGPLAPPSADARRLHRVMTDDLEIVGVKKDFDYRIVLP